MSVIVDTSVWSLALRRNNSNSAIAQELQTLVNNNQVVMLGVIRQEVLSGIRSLEQFERLRDELRAFLDLDLVTEDYELAAAFFNTCRRNGIQGSNTDFLICAAAQRREYEIFTLDQDFQNFQRYISIALFVPT